MGGYQNNNLIFAVNVAGLWAVTFFSFQGGYRVL